MVELRKRKAPAEPAPPPPAKKKNNPVKAIAEKAKNALTGKNESSAASASNGPPTVGSVISLDDFGGEVATNEGEKTTLKKLVDESAGGVVLFTYPKASTPGCTKQACFFRDDYTPLTATGFAIYGLSRDSDKANTTFKTKNKLPYTLLCDSSSSLISAIGMKKGASTTRGVFVIDKTGKVLAAEAGSPASTVETVKKLVEKGDVENSAGAEKVLKAPPTQEEGTAASAASLAANGEVSSKEDKASADVAAEVANTAAKLDKTPTPAPAASA